MEEHTSCADWFCLGPIACVPERRTASPCGKSPIPAYSLCLIRAVFLRASCLPTMGQRCPARFHDPIDECVNRKARSLERAWLLAFHALRAQSRSYLPSIMSMYAWHSSSRLVGTGKVSRSEKLAAIAAQVFFVQPAAPSILLPEIPRSLLSFINS